MRDDGLRTLQLLYLIGGVIGLAAALILAVEKVELLKDPTYTPSCSLNPVLNCGSVMVTPQAEAFGLPNPFLGLVGFSVIAATGALLQAGAVPRRWYWLGLQGGVTFAAGFVGWLVFQSLYRIGALCPYCMVVWAVTVPLFVYTTLWNARSGVFGERIAGSRTTAAASTNHALLLTIAYLGLLTLVLERFWTYWNSLVRLT